MTRTPIEEEVAARRAQGRRYYAANAEKMRAWQRAYRAENAERINAQVRARRAANPERMREISRAYRQANAEKIAEQARLRNARRDRAKDRATQLRRIHGMTLEEWAQMSAAQDGKCYLCGDILLPEPRQSVVDHDHACCGPRKSCAACRRGLACARCNKILGFVRDDPETLRRIADSLETASKARSMRLHAALTPFLETP